VTFRVPKALFLVVAVLIAAAAGALADHLASKNHPSKTTTVTRTVTATATAAPAPIKTPAPLEPPDCVTGTQSVLILVYGPDSSNACTELGYRIMHTFAADASPSLDHGSHAGASAFASDGNGNRVVVIEEGSDQGDINTTIAGVLTGLGYTVKPTWRDLVLP
jgi:hypothetical protein